MSDRILFYRTADAPLIMEIEGIPFDLAEFEGDLHSFVAALILTFNLTKEELFNIAAALEAVNAYYAEKGIYPEDFDASFDYDTVAESMVGKEVANDFGDEDDDY